jgi:hypothetical protein
MQKLHRDTKGRFKPAPHVRITSKPRQKSLCGRDCSIFYTCKRNKIENIGKPCEAKARLPSYKNVLPYGMSYDNLYSIRDMAKQEHELRLSACENGD